MGHGEVVATEPTTRRPPARAAVVAAVVAACGMTAAAVRLAVPLRYEVSGVSMAPGLLPGDTVATGVVPLRDGLRPPCRFDRWVLAAPDGASAVKRLVGLPGETVSIVGGDLAIDGRAVPPAPAVLAERATAIDVAAAASPAAGGRERTFPAVAAVDDAAFAPRERRVLLPVRDVGLSAVVRLARGTPPADVCIRVDGLAVRWRIAAAGRHAFVAGRLDGHVVGVTWPLAAADRAEEVERSGLPPHPPAAWDVVRGAAPDTPGESAAAPVATLLAIAIEGAPADGAVAIESLGAWRDLLYRPAADGRESWTLGTDEFFLLGDFPSGSRDSRHWGPLPRASLRHRVAAVAARGG